MLLLAVCQSLLYMHIASAPLPQSIPPQPAAERYYELTVCGQDYCVEFHLRYGIHYRHSDGWWPPLPLTEDCRCLLRELKQSADIEKAQAQLKETDARAAGYMPGVFAGFENPRYQRHDRTIALLAADFNANKMLYADCTAEQAATIPDLDPDLFKALLIQESGGNQEAWSKDPAQVNVPGDWGPYKIHAGLRKPRQRNEGELHRNLEAALKFLVRKGFGISAQPARNRPAGYFDNWELALRRYNGRSDKTGDDRPYKEVYADKIIARASNRHRHEPVEIPRKKLGEFFFDIFNPADFLLCQAIESREKWCVNQIQVIP